MEETNQTLHTSLLATMWKHRPSALQRRDYDRLSMGQLLQHYTADNRRAKEVVVPLPTTTTTLTQEPNNRKQPRCLRVVSWNVHFFVSPSGKKTTSDLVQEILRHDPDVVVLNEFGAAPECHIGSEACKFQQTMMKQGYTTYKVANVEYPTAMFARLPAVSIEDITLDQERHALAMCLLWTPKIDANNVLDKEQKPVWIYGTHLTHKEYWDGHRHQEMTALLNHVHAHTNQHHDLPVLIVGDFNQQREDDYTPEEWQRILASKERRSARDSPVDLFGLFEEHGFVCVWDRDDDGDVDHEDDDVTPADKSTSDSNPRKCCWIKGQPPPATHWSGTIIDYKYSSRRLRNRGTFVSPSGLSDHRLIVTDWEILT